MNNFEKLEPFNYEWRLHNRFPKSKGVYKKSKINLTPSIKKEYQGPI